MSKINNFNDYTSKYNTNADYSYLFEGTQTASTSSDFSLLDYASIKNGSYGKLLKILITYRHLNFRKLLCASFI